MSLFWSRVGDVVGTVARGAGNIAVELGKSGMNDAKKWIDKRKAEIAKFEEKYKRESDSNLKSRYSRTGGAEQIAIRNILKNRGYRLDKETNEWK